MAQQERIDLGLRIGHAKGQMPDEGITRSQLTAGSGVNINVKENWDIELSTNTIAPSIQHIVVQGDIHSTTPIWMDSGITFNLTANTEYELRLIAFIGCTDGDNDRNFLYRWYSPDTATVDVQMWGKENHTVEDVNYGVSYDRRSFSNNAEYNWTPPTATYANNTIEHRLILVADDDTTVTFQFARREMIPGDLDEPYAIILRQHSYATLTAFGTGENSHEDKYAAVTAGGTAGYLADKIIAGDNVSLAITLDDKLEISSTGGGGSLPTASPWRAMRSNGDTGEWEATDRIISIYNYETNINVVDDNNTDTKAKIKAAVEVIDLSANGARISLRADSANTVSAQIDVFSGLQNDPEEDKSFIRFSSNAFQFKNHPGLTTASGDIGQVLTMLDSDGVATFQDLPETYSPPANAETVYHVRKDITAGELRVLIGSPVEIVPAAGSGKFIHVMGVACRFKYNTAVYTGTSVDSLLLSVATSAALYYAQDISISGSSNKVIVPSLVVLNNGDVVNYNVSLVNPSGTITGGAASDSFVSLIIDVAYRIVDFN